MLWIRVLTMDEMIFLAIIDFSETMLESIGVKSWLAENFPHILFLLADLTLNCRFISRNACQSLIRPSCEPFNYPLHYRQDMLGGYKLKADIS